MKRITVLAVVLAATVATGQYLEMTREVPDTFGYLSSPGQVLVNPVTGNCWVTSSGGVLVFDPATRVRQSRIRASGLAVLCPEVGKGYVFEEEAFAVVDLHGDTLTRRLMINYAEFPGAAWSPTSNKLYVSANDDDHEMYWMLVLDPALDTVVTAVSLPHWLTAPVWDPVTNRVLVGVGEESETAYVAAIDCVADTLLALVPSGLEGVACLALGATERRLYCSGDGSGPGRVVQVLDADGLDTLGLVANLDWVDTLAYSPVTGWLYCFRADSVHVVDCGPDTVRARVALPRDARGVACSPLTGKAYFPLNGPAGLAVVDTFDVARLVGELPDTTLMSARVAGCHPVRNEVYCACYQDTILLADGAADTLAGVVEYHYYNIRGLVYNPAGNKLYCAAYNSDELLVLDAGLNLLRTIQLRGFDADAGILLNPALNRLYLADDELLQVVDCNTDQLIATLAIPGVEEARLVLYPPLGKLYVFTANDFGGDIPVYVYDCLRNEVVDSVAVDDEVPCAVYHPRSDRIYFGCKSPPNFRVLDPRTDSIVDTLRLGSDVTYGKMLANTEQDVVYFANDRDGVLYTYDVRGDTVIDADTLAFDADTLFWNRNYGKLYVVREATGSNLQVLDCRTGELSEVMSLEYEKAGVMDERYDKLYFGGSENYHTKVLDCRTDSVVADLPFAKTYPYAMAWNPVDGRVFAVRTNAFSVYREDPPGVEEMPNVEVRMPNATIVRGVLWLSETSGVGRGAFSVLLDITGRRVMDLAPGENDVRFLAPGVYFVRVASGVERRAASVRKVVVQR